MFEWVRLVHAGNGVDTDDFFMYYFFLTGIHFVHLLIGFVVLGIIVYQLRSPAPAAAPRRSLSKPAQRIGTPSISSGCSSSRCCTW